MATYTPNFSLTMPDYAEPADVAVLNGNTSQIDSLIYQGRRMAVGGYDSTQTYNTGDLVEYSNALYRCKEDGVTGTWDSTKWELTTLADEIESKGEGGADVTKEVSGNPVEFTDGADAPLVKCDVTISPQQDLHGQDKPWVGGSGKNKAKQTVDGIKARNSGLTWVGNTTTVNNGTVTILTDNADNVIGYKFNGNFTQEFLFSVDDVSYVASENVIVSGCPSGSPAALEVWRSGSVIAQDTGSGVSVNAGSMALVIRVPNNASMSNLVYTPMIRLSTESDSTFEPYSNICPISGYSSVGVNESNGGVDVYDSDGTTGNNSNSIIDIISKDSFRVYNTRNQTFASSKQELSLYEMIDGKTYTVEADVTITSGVALLTTRNSGNTVLSTTGVITQDGHYKLTFVKTAEMSKLSFFDTWDSSIQGDVTYSNIRLYEGTTLKTCTISLGGTYYSGQIDVVKGMLRATSKMELFDNTANVSFGRANYDNWYYTISSAEILTESVIPISNKYVGAYVLNDNNDLGIYKIGSTGQVRVRVGGTKPADTSAFVADLGTTPLQVLYDLPTPIEIPLTPTTIKSLLDNNTMWTDGDTLEVEYITKDFQPIVDLIEANASEPYSDDYTLDTEIEVGTWVDGSTLYRKTKEITGTKNAGYEGTIYTAGSGEHIVKLDGCIYNDYYSGMAYPINMAYSTNNGTMAFSTFVTGSNAEEVLFKNGWNSAISKIYLVVYYIKSSS